MFILDELEKNQKLYEGKKISNKSKLVMDSAVISVKYIFDLADELKQEDEYQDVIYRGMDILCSKAEAGLDKLRKNILEMEEDGTSIYRKIVEEKYFKEGRK